MTDYFSLVINNLKRRKLRSWLTILGIVIGIAAIVSLISLGNALQEAVLGQFSTLSADKLTIQNSGTGFGPPGSTSVKKLTDHDVKVIERVANIDSVVPRLVRVVGVEYNGVKNFEFATTILNDEKKNKIIYESFNIRVKAGRLLNSEDRGKVLLGDGFTGGNRYEKNLRVGSKILIQGKEFEVVGILQKSSSFQVNDAIFMNEDDLKQVLNLGDEFDLIVAQVNDEKNTEKAAEDIKRALRKDRGEKEGDEDFSVETPLQALSTVSTILGVINIIISSIAAISLIIGGIGVMNTMYTSVLERTREIGTMKAVGARNSDILKLFLLESALVGLVGGVLGILIGLGLAYGVAAIAGSALGSLEFKVAISWTLIFGVMIFSLVVGILSGVLPAMQASRMKPVEALRA